MTQERRDAFIPISWVSKQDLRNARPDLLEQIDALDDQSMHIIAKQVGDALQDTYRLAVEMALLAHLGVHETTDADFNAGSTHALS